MAIRTLYETPKKRGAETGMAVTLGKNEEDGVYGIGFFNLNEGLAGFVLFEREHLAELRDALNRELAS